MAVDTLGRLLALCMTAVNEQDRAQVSELAERVRTETGETVEIAHVASPVGGRAEFRVDVSIRPVSERLRAITGNPGRSTLPGLRDSDVKERRGNTDLKLITL